MTNEHYPDADGPEPAIAEPDPSAVETYQQSIDVLFDLLPPRRTRIPHYYQATWDETDPVKLREATLATITPTGALRQERWGAFHSGQFQLDERPHYSGGKHRQFVWLPVVPQYAGTRAEVDEAGFREKYGYELLSRPHVVSELARRATSVPEHLALLQAMEERGFEPVPELTKRVNRFIWRLAQSDFVAEATEGKVPDRDEVFELVKAYQALGVEPGKGAQGYLVSQLLRTIAMREVNQTEPVVRASQRATALMYEAMDRGVIGNEVRNMHRILGSNAMYYSMPTTDIALEYLRGQTEGGRQQYVFGRNRVGFTHEYITRVLRADGMPPLDDVVEGFLTHNRTSDRWHDKLQQLYDLLNALRQLVEVPDADEPVDAPGAVASAYRQVVHRLHGAKLAAFDARSVELIEMVMRPVTARTLGSLAMQASEEELSDIDYDELI